MLILAVDTSGKNGSLALVRANHPTQANKGLEWGTQNPTQANRGLGWGTQNITRSGFDVLELVPLAGRMYSAQLIPELQNALARQNLRKTDIDAYAVASGPGSFTGLRVGLSTVKALSEVQHKPIAAVSALEAAARMTGESGRIVVALDAGRKQAFVGEYEFDDRGQTLSAKESLVSLESFLDPTSGISNEMRGTIYSPHENVGEALANRGVTAVEVAAPQADMFARIGYQKILAGETTPAEILEANYIRASDAELFSLPKLMS